MTRHQKTPSASIRGSSAGAPTVTDGLAGRRAAGRGNPEALNPPVDPPYRSDPSAFRGAARKVVEIRVVGTHNRPLTPGGGACG